MSLNVLQGNEQLAKGVLVPQNPNLTEDLKIFESLPSNDTPQTFGLPPTADISVQKLKSIRMVEKIRSITQEKKEGGDFDVEAWKRGLGSLIQLWKSKFFLKKVYIKKWLEVILLWLRKKILQLQIR